MIKSQIIVKHKNLKPYELALSLLYLKHLPNLMYSQSYSTVSLTCDDEEFQAQLIIDIWTGICPIQFFCWYLFSIYVLPAILIFIMLSFLLEKFGICLKLWIKITQTHFIVHQYLNIYIKEKRIIKIMFYNMVSEKRVRCFVNVCYSN